MRNENGFDYEERSDSAVGHIVRLSVVIILTWVSIFIVVLVGLGTLAWMFAQG